MVAIFIIAIWCRFRIGVATIGLVSIIFNIELVVAIFFVRCDTVSIELRVATI